MALWGLTKGVLAAAGVSGCFGFVSFLPLRLNDCSNAFSKCVSSGLLTSLGLATIAFAIALFHAVAFGLPLFLWLREFKIGNKLISLLAGFLIGFIPILAITFDSSPAKWQEGFLVGLIPYLMLGVVGAISGLTAWIVWNRSLPLKSQNV